MPNWLIQDSIGVANAYSGQEILVGVKLENSVLLQLTQLGSRSPYSYGGQSWLNSTPIRVAPGPWRGAPSSRGGPPVHATWALSPGN